MVIRAIVFDAYGTLYDVQSVGSLANELCGNKGELITQLWRLKQLEYSWLHSLMRDYRDFWPLTRASLEFSLKSVGIEPDPALCERLMGKYLELDLHEDSRVALDELDDYELAILSNGSQPMLDALVASSGLGDRFAAGISVERGRAFKPDPACYALVEPALGVAPAEVLFVSSNGFDVAGAKRFGFNVVWIARSQHLPAPPTSDIGPAEFYRLMRAGQDRLGHDADYRVARLTDLAALLARQ